MPHEDIETLREPEKIVELINLDCYNELFPSDANCDGPWLYWYDERTWGEWREDGSLSLYCTGNFTF